MSNMKQNRVYIDPGDIEGALKQLALVYDLDGDTLQMLKDIVELYPRPVMLYVDEANAPLNEQSPLVDRFTFNMQTDELVLFSSDPMTFIDAMIEMAMYVAGFSTMMGVEQYWKVEFCIGAWKPVRNRIKRRLGIPVLDEPVWVVGLPPTSEDALLEDPHPFRTLVAQLDLGSFTQMVRLAARDDVEVDFPTGTDPLVIQVYIRMKTAMEQVAEGLVLDDWREFNHRLLAMVEQLEQEYAPARLPVPVWWKHVDDRTEEELVAMTQHDPEVSRAAGPSKAQDGTPAEAETAEESAEWNPFEAFIDTLFEDSSDYWDLQ